MMRIRISKNVIPVVICFILAMKGISADCEPFFRQFDLFVSGEEYHNYRIPSIIITLKGTILAFCEARGEDSDTGNIDIVMKRSLDNGKTWEPMSILFDDGDNVCGNPCPVVDRKTGTVFLLLTHNLGQDHQKDIQLGTSFGTRTIWVMKSTDEGITWSKPVNITRTAKRSNGGFCGTGPGTGIQLSTDRLVIPSYDHVVGEVGEKWYSGPWPSYIIYSDDHGVTWNRGKPTVGYGSECQVVELFDGTLMLNIRDQNIKKRGIACSSDGGLNWSEVTFDETLIDPHCQASIIRLTDEKTNDRNRILFSNPASTIKREKMTIRLSYDECKTWTVSKQLTSDLSAYSCLGVLGDGTITCLYERGKKVYNEAITLAFFNLEWLTDGADRLPGN